MKHLLIFLLFLSHGLMVCAQSPGDLLIPVKTANGRAERVVTLTNGQVLGLSGGVPAALNLSSLADGDKGSITVSGGGSTWTIDSGAVTNAMLAGGITNAKLSSSAITIAGTSTALGESISLDTLTGLAGTGLIKRSGVNTLAIASAGTDYVTPGGALGTPSSGTLSGCSGLPVTGITASTSAALGVGSIELGHATDSTLARVSAGVASIEGATIATLSGTNTWTQTQSLPGITGTGGGGLYLLINGNNTSGTMIGTSGYAGGITVGSAGGIGFSSGAPSSGQDTQLRRAAAGIMTLTTGTSTTGAALQLRTQTAPAAPSAGQANLWLEDNGSGKLRLMVRFPSGAAQQIAIEP